MSGPERLTARSRGGGAGTRATPETEQPARLRPADAPGRPLPAGVRARMETAFGAEFPDVRVREDGEATAMDAAAFTRGEGITFHPGLYHPSSVAGLEVLGHELAHVLQQRAGRVPGTGVTEDPGLEAEAHEAGRRAAAGQPVPELDAGGAAAGSAGLTDSGPAGTGVAQPAGPLDRFRHLFRRGGAPAPHPPALHPPAQPHHQRIPADLLIHRTNYQPIPRFDDENPYDTLPEDFNERVEAENPYDTLPEDFNERVEAENPYGVFRPVPDWSGFDEEQDPIYNTLPAHVLKELQEGPYHTIPPELRATEDDPYWARHKNKPLPPLPKRRGKRVHFGDMQAGPTGSGQPRQGAVPARGILRGPRGPRG